MKALEEMTPVERETVFERLLILLEAIYLQAISECDYEMRDAAETIFVMLRDEFARPSSGDYPHATQIYSEALSLIAAARESGFLAEQITIH